MAVSRISTSSKSGFSPSSCRLSYSPPHISTAAYLSAEKEEARHVTESPSPINASWLSLRKERLASFSLQATGCHWRRANLPCPFSNSLTLLQRPHSISVSVYCPSYESNHLHQDLPNVSRHVVRTIHALCDPSSVHQSLAKCLRGQVDSCLPPRHQTSASSPPPLRMSMEPTTSLVPYCPALNPQHCILMQPQARLSRDDMD